MFEITSSYICKVLIMLSTTIPLLQMIILNRLKRLILLLNVDI